MSEQQQHEEAEISTLTPEEEAEARRPRFFRLGDVLGGVAGQAPLPEGAVEITTEEFLAEQTRREEAQAEIEAAFGRAADEAAAAAAAAAEEQAAHKASALDKLMALGLSEAEARAIAGV